METEKRISAKALAAGVGVYLAGLLLIFVVGVLLGSTAAYRAAQAGAGQQQIAEQIARRLAGPGFAVTTFGLASVFTLLGGFAAARFGRPEGPRHALPVGLLSLFAGILFVLFMPFHVPVWLLPVVLLLPVPLALAGGRLAARARASAADPEEADFEPGPSEEEEAARLVARRLKSEEQHSRLVGHLVQQRVEQESQWQRQRAEEDRRRALERAVQQSKAEACDDLRAVVREAFMSHPAATEADFERCWPELRDEMFRQHALRVYRSRGARAGEEV